MGKCAYDSSIDADVRRGPCACDACVLFLIKFLLRSNLLWSFTFITFYLCNVHTMPQHQQQHQDHASRACAHSIKIKYAMWKGKNFAGRWETEWRRPRTSFLQCNLFAVFNIIILFIGNRATPVISGSILTVMRSAAGTSPPRRCHL